MFPRADRRRRCLVGATGLLVSGLLATGAAGTAYGTDRIVVGGESWAPELALEGGDDRGVVLADGGVRPVSRAEGVLTVAPRRLLGPTEEITATLSADLPPGTDVDLQVRGLDARGAWGPWATVPERAPAHLGSATTEVQVRLLLHGAAAGPTVRGAWLTAVPAETYGSVAASATTTMSPTASPPRTSTPSRPTSPTPTVVGTAPPSS